MSTSFSKSKSTLSKFKSKTSSSFKSRTSTKFKHKKTDNPRLRTLNQHIDFNREGKKTAARKWPTDVICVSCKKKFTLPFKPRKPEVYCDACFKKAKKSNK